MKDAIDDLISEFEHRGKPPSRRGVVSMCEKCWADAYDPYLGGSQAERYNELLKERKDSPCSPEDQAGEWWDEERQIDSRRERKDLPESTLVG